MRLSSKLSIWPNYRLYILTNDQKSLFIPFILFPVYIINEKTSMKSFHRSFIVFIFNERKSKIISFTISASAMHCSFLNRNSILVQLIHIDSILQKEFKIVGNVPEPCQVGFKRNFLKYIWVHLELSI